MSITSHDGRAGTGAFAIDLSDVREAAQRIAPYAHRTPVLTSRSIDERAGCRVFMKCENFQRIGAFKFRGAMNAVLQLPQDVRAVATHSSGNHAQAIALAARLRGIDAWIVMPRNAPAVKRQAVADLGGHVILCEPTLAARESQSQRAASEHRAQLIPPYNHPHVMAGQGTAALELLEEAGALDAMICPVGGGGLASGMCIAARGIQPDIRLLGAEPAGADDAARSLAAGELIPQTAPNTIADGLLTSLGDLTWPVLQAHLDAIFTAPDDEISRAMRFVMERVKIMLEPSCAVPFAAIFGDAFAAWRDQHGIRSIGLIVSGGNVDLDRLPWQPESHRVG